MRLGKTGTLDVYDIIWLFSKDREPVTELVVEGKVKSDENRSRLRVTDDCSLEVKTLRKEDEGLYNCIQYPPASSSFEDHARYTLRSIVSISILIYLPKCTLLCWNQSMRMRIWPVTCFKYSYLNIVSCVLWWRFKNPVWTMRWTVDSICVHFLTWIETKLW